MHNGRLSFVESVANNWFEVTGRSKSSRIGRQRSFRLSLVHHSYQCCVSGRDNAYSSVSIDCTLQLSTIREFESTLSQFRVLGESTQVSQGWGYANGKAQTSMRSLIPGGDSAYDNSKFSCSITLWYR